MTVYIYVLYMLIAHSQPILKLRFPSDLIYYAKLTTIKEIEDLLFTYYQI